MNDPITHPLTRRQALATLAAPFLASCVDRIAGPAFSLSQMDGPATLIGAGDIHAASFNFADRQKTAAQVKAVLDADPMAWAFAAGDLTHNGTEKELLDYYAPTWGQFKDRTLFCFGNHDRYPGSGTPPGAAYYAYTGAQKFYAQTMGSWRCYVLNCETLDLGGAGTLPQLEWMKADIAENPNLHYFAIWHYPQFSNVCATHGKAMTWPGKTGPWWDALVAVGAEFVISGHAHRYERFKQKLKTGTASAQGIRQFMVGTAGGHTMGVLTKHVDCEKFIVSKGVVRFDLYPDRYEWKFTDLAGVVRDSGIQLCRKVLA